jgi:hypothetical protein
MMVQPIARPIIGPTSRLVLRAPVARFRIRASLAGSAVMGPWSRSLIAPISRQPQQENSKRTAGQASSAERMRSSAALPLSVSSMRTLSWSIPYPDSPLPNLRTSMLSQLSMR